MFFNKPKKHKEPKRVGKPPESVQFKNALTKKLNTSGYETIRSIVDKDEHSIILPQGDKTYKNDNSNLNTQKKCSNVKKSK